MKKVLSLLITLTILISCGTPRGFSTSFFETKTTNPQEIVDSIRISNSLPAIPRYREWVKSMYFTSDSMIATQYVIMTQKVDTTYIFSITEVAEDSIRLIKFRKE